MNKDTLHFDAKEKLATGIRKVAKAVGSTMGTAGGNAIIEAMQSPGHITTNDGFSIANSIVLADPIEDMGRKILLESINRANKQSGDGSSTTCVLTAAIIEEGMKTEGAHPMEIKRSMEELVPFIEENIRAQSREITVDDVHQVASISAEDEQIGKTIGEIYKEIGKTGIIHWDISKTAEDSYTIGSGITVEGATYISPYMCDASESGQNTNQIRIKDAYVLLTTQKLASASDLNQIAQELYNKEVRDLVIFVDEFEPLIVPDLINLRAKRGFRIAIVKMPTIFKDVWYQDLAVTTGATVISAEAGLPMRELKFEHLGRVENVIITKDETHLDGIKDVSAHIEALKEEGSEAAELRIARLNTKTARYYVGAHSESALSYRRLKVEDAISAAWQALNGGIVAGGGVALRKVSDSVDGSTPGALVVKRALQAPELQIWRNAGIKEVGIPGPSYMGVDTRTRKTVDMFEAGIIDPTNVVINAVKNAISVAATVLTAPTVITLPRQEEAESPDAVII